MVYPGTTMAYTHTFHVKNNAWENMWQEQYKGKMAEGI